MFNRYFPISLLLKRLYRLYSSHNLTCAQSYRVYIDSAKVAQEDAVKGVQWSYGCRTILFFESFLKRKEFLVNGTQKSSEVVRWQKGLWVHC